MSYPLVPSLFALALLLGLDQNDPAPTQADLTAPPERIEGCHEKLKAAGVRFKKRNIPLHPSPSGLHQCGAPQVVRYSRGPGKLRYHASPNVSCKLALAMSKMELVIQEEALKHLGKRVYRIRHIGTYNCREMSAYPGWVSEHSYANAIDLAEFTLTDGRKISVLDHYKQDNQKGRFLRSIADRFVEEKIFSVVLTPNFDSLHHNHLHLDMAHYVVDGR